MKNKQATLIIDTKEVNKDNYTVKGVFSTESTDRHGDVVIQDGWQLENYLKNAVVLFGHNHYELPVGKMIELAVEEIDGEKKLVGTIQFAVNEYDFAKTVFALYAGGYMKAFSVGFINLDYKVDYNEDTDEVTYFLTKNELLEVSCVPVPANAESLVKAANDGVDLKPYAKGLEKIAAAEKKSAGVSVEHIKALNDVVDVLREYNAILSASNEKATDADENQLASKNKSDASASPTGEGSDNSNEQLQITRGKVKHRINRVIRAMAEVKSTL